MTYYEDLLAERKRKIEQLNSNRPEQIAQQENQARDILAGQDVKRNRGTEDILGTVSARYGIDPSVVSAGRSFQQETSPAQLRARENQFTQQRMSNLSKSYQKDYDYALDAYQNAGYNLQQSDEFARQWLKQQSEQQFQAETASRAREDALAKDKISAEYGDLRAGIQQDQGNPYMDALIRSLTGLAPYAGYAAYQKYGQKQVGNTQPVVNNTAGTQGIDYYKLYGNKGTAGIGGYGTES